MGKSLRKTAVVLLSVFLAFSAVGCSGSTTDNNGQSGKPGSEEKTEYSVSVTQTSGGNATVDKSEVKVGDTVTVTAKPNADYEVEKIDVNGASYSATNGIMRFIMPECDTTVTPKFKKTSFGNTFGSFGTAECGEHWELDKDYAKDSAFYAQRQIKLSGTDRNNNLLFFSETVNNDSFVRATFKVDDIYASEQHGKFGLMLFDGDDVDSSDGVFFYADAFVGDHADKLIRGTDLGYNSAAWDENGYTAIETDGAFDLETQTVTLAMSYRNGEISLFYGDAEKGDVFIKRLKHKAEGDFAIGIVSFNYGLTVTDYTVVTDTDSEEFNGHVATDDKRKIDVLFAGDSFMEYWKNYGVYNTLVYDMRKLGVKFANIGIGGSQAVYWASDAVIDNIKRMYIPGKIVFHVGVNDIDIGGSTSKEDAYNRIVSMYSKYHAAFPNAEMYWVSLIPNKFWDSAKHEIYKGVNNLMKGFAARTAYLDYIDVENAFTDETGNARANMLADGMHLNSVYGYPMWTSLIKKALGYENYVMPADDAASRLGNHSRRAATLGWEYGKDGNIVTLDYEINTPFLGKKVHEEEYVFYKDIEDSDVLFEAEIRSDGAYASSGSRVGVSLVNDNVTLFTYFDLTNGQFVSDVKFITRGLRSFTQADVAGASQFGGCVAEIGKPCGISANWNWRYEDSYRITTVDLKGDYVKIGIAKHNSSVYLIVNGNVIAEIRDVDGVTNDSKFIAGVASVGGNVAVKSVKAVSGADEVESALDNLNYRR